MKIILLDYVSNLGNMGKQINVKSGYARNFLIPQGKAVIVNKKNIEYFKERYNKFNEKMAIIRIEAENRAKKISLLESVTIQSKAGNEGKLFGSIGVRKIAKAITNLGIDISKNEIRLPHGVLRTIGNHIVKIQVHNEISININIIVEKLQS